MTVAPFRIQLTWDDPLTGDRRSPILMVPIALGREFAQMPAQLGEQRVSRIVLASEEISRFQSLITLESTGLVITDQNSSNGTFVNGVLRSQSLLAHGDLLQLGPYTITVSFAVAPPPALQPEPQPQALPEVFQRSQVSLQDLHATGLSVQEADYAAVGGGLGNFCWVDWLRICGVSTTQIVVLGATPQPYAADPSFNPDHAEQERLRADTCLDNIWGLPSYALRAVGQDLGKGRIGSALNHLWQVIAGSTFAEPYEPRAAKVWAAIDREANRIGWEEMFCDGQAQAIRKTGDGRYAIAYSHPNNPHDLAFLVARSVQVEKSPQLHESVSQSELTLNPSDDFSLTSTLELAGTRNGRGRLYTTGVTSEPSESADDPFGALQDAAFRAVEDLLHTRAPGLRRLHALRSQRQWWKWIWNQSPD